MLDRILPILYTLRNYSRKKFGSDLIAGITVATILIPQGMAYAILAGVPPIYGLYAGLLPLIIYAIFGTSRQMSIGPVAVSALLVLSGVGAIAEPGSAEFITLVITAGLFIGITQMLLSFVRLGFLVNFISHPVIAGFTSAAAIIILGSQLKDALGIPMPRLESVLEYFIYTIEHISETNWIATVLCFSAVAIMMGLKRINKAIPGALIVVVVGTIFSYFLNFQQYGVEIIKNVPEGLPSFMIPQIDMETFRKLIPVVLTVTIIGIVESISIAKVLEAKHRDYTINPNQELFALGISKFISSFFQAIPSSGSFTRSAINSNSGAKTTLSSTFTAVIIMISLLFLTPLFYYIPKAVLAAIILLAVFSLLDIKEGIHLWKTHKRDFIMMLITFMATLIFGIEEGVLFGVVLSILAVLYKSSKPHVAVLGRIPGTNFFRNLDRFPEAEPASQSIIIRFDDQMYFANSSYFKDTVNQLISKSKDKELKYILLDASNVHDIDSTGVHMLLDLDEDFKDRNLELHICGATGPVRDMLYKNKMLNLARRHHMNVLDAVNQISSEHGDIKKHRKSLQTNIKEENGS